jgi:hypothetical protein
VPFRTDSNLNLLCPLPISDTDRCTGELYLTWERAYGLGASDLDGDAPKPDGAHSSSWEVVCTEGHVILVPLNGAEDYATFEAADLKRLEAVLAITTATAAA